MNIGKIFIYLSLQIFLTQMFSSKAMFAEYPNLHDPFHSRRNITVRNVYPDPVRVSFDTYNLPPYGRETLVRSHHTAIWIQPKQEMTFKNIPGTRIRFSLMNFSPRAGFCEAEASLQEQFELVNSDMTFTLDQDREFPELFYHSYLNANIYLGN